jgi:hypothetical protein
MFVEFSAIFESRVKNSSPWSPDRAAGVEKPGIPSDFPTTSVRADL